MYTSYIVKIVKNKLLSKKKEVDHNVTTDDSEIMTAKTFTFLFTKNSKLKCLIYESQVALCYEKK